MSFSVPTTPRRRYIPLPTRPPSLSPTSLNQLHEQLSNFLAHALSYTNEHAQDYPRATVYSGLAGISLLNHHIAPFVPHLTSRQTAHSQLVSALQSDPLQPPSSGSKVAFLDTSVGPATLVLYYQLCHFSAPSSQQPPFSIKECAWCARLLHDAANAATQDDEGIDAPEDGCELLYGRAGLLYALLLLKSTIPAVNGGSPDSPNSGFESLVELLRSLTRTATLKLLVDDLIRRGRAGAARFSAESRLTEGPGLMWVWHGKRYLGAAHGIAGILDVILHCPESILVTHASVICNTVEHLLFLQDPSGNWPSSASTMPVIIPKSSELVQWCHGSTGVIPLLASILQRAKALRLSSDLRSATLSSLDRAAALTYARGLTRKGPGLCHGASASACALLMLADCSAIPPEARQRHLWHGMHLAQCIAELQPRGGFADGDRPSSLYEGLSGACVAVAIVVCKLDTLLGRSRSGGVMRTGILGAADLPFL
ncbi:hypothetical protein PENSPDRAFT_681467 [Peniophora sp. CONT]|nr:hypothetical protein PENSPDRAFT_681467 [Peniophora sp. CONT]